MAQAGLALDFDSTLRQARAADAAHLEAVHAISDAASLRLQMLKDELAGIVAAAPQAREAFELALAPGDTPRLWIDLITSVVMEPDPKTYRLLRDGHGVFETADRAEMVQQVKLAMAHGIIARKRRAAVRGLTDGASERYSAVALAVAGVGGFALGALALASAAIYLKMFIF